MSQRQRRERSQSSKSLDEQDSQERSREKKPRIEYNMGPDIHLTSTLIYDTEHFFFCHKSQNSIGYPIAVWNFCTMFRRRPANCLIILESQKQIHQIVKFNSMNRKVAFLGDKDNFEISSFLTTHKADTLMVTTKKASILIAKREVQPIFSTIINVGFQKDAEHYRRLHQFLHKSGGNFISFIAHKRDIDKMEKSLGLTFNELNGQLSPEDTNKEIIENIQFSEAPKAQTYALLKMLPYSSEQIGARLLQILQNNYRSSDRSMHLNLLGYVTYQVKTDVEFNSYKYIWNYLNDLPEDIVEGVRNMVRFSNMKGVVFNVPIQCRQQIDHFIRKQRKYSRNTSKYQMSLVYQMPQIQDQQSEQFKQLELKRTYALKNKDSLQVYIGGLPVKADESSIKKFLLNFNVTTFSIRILKDRDGVSKGICFALCQDEQHFKRALQLDESKFEGKTIKVQVAKRESR